MKEWFHVLFKIGDIRMRSVKILLALAMFIGLSACSCRKSNNIADATEGGPLSDVHFAFDSYAIEPAAKEILKSNAEWLTENDTANVTIEGHCDERGTAEYNMALSAKRANAVLDYMKTLGIDAARMTTAPYGEELPLDPGHDEAAWSKNRRAHFDVK